MNAKFGVLLALIEQKSNRLGASLGTSTAARVSCGRVQRRAAHEWELAEASILTPYARAREAGKLFDFT
jgi:hypothetical protein